MKLKYFNIAFVFSLLVVMVACSLDGESNYQPQFQFVKNAYVLHGDTLYMHYTDVSNTYRMDTVHVGDTIVFPMLINGYTNNLQTFTLTQYSDSSTRVILPVKSSLDSIFNTTYSNYSKGIFYFKTKISTTLYFPFKIVARKESLASQISLFVASDANFESNSSTVIIKTPIAAKE